MEEDILPVIPSQQLYSRASIVAAMLLSGPLAGGYMVAENFKSLNQPKRALITWIFAVVSILLMLGIGYSFERLPNFVLPLVFAISASRLITHFQQQDIVQHQKEGGKIFSGWRVLLIGIIGLVITVTPILIVAFLVDSMSS